MEKVTYEDIKKANEKIKPITIKRKDKETGKIISKKYSEVNQRIMAFRMVYPNGTIETDVNFPNEGICICRATIRDENGDVLANGTACEVQSSSFINKMSYVENCETSAVGRALGMCGFGINNGVATADEIKNSIENEQTTPYDFENIGMTEEQIEKIANLETNIKNHIRKTYKKDPMTLTRVEAEIVISSLKKNGLIKSKEDREKERKETEEVF